MKITTGKTRLTIGTQRGPPSRPLLLARQHRQRVRLALRAGGRRQVVEIKAGATLGTDQFKGLRYYNKLATALPVEQDYYLIYGGEERQERAHGIGIVLGWRDVGELAATVG